MRSRTNTSPGTGGAGPFRTVFQPIFELRSRVIVGYEALSRFATGTPPDSVFANAHATGFGLELELRTLAAAFEAAGSLPASAWLNVNVSAEALVTDALRGLIAANDWQIVLELTEHTPVADYGALRAAIRRLGPTVRLSIDDAGAGYANFRHILELHPQYVKLDRLIVDGVADDRAKQALLEGLGHFAKRTSCTLIAEGITNERDLLALIQVGVPLGQGFHLAPPALAPELGPFARRAVRTSQTTAQLARGRRSRRGRRDPVGARTGEPRPTA